MLMPLIIALIFASAAGLVFTPLAALPLLVGGILLLVALEKMEP
jgi:hypothetical protein